jgi:hypothetical protein
MSLPAATETPSCLVSGHVAYYFLAWMIFKAMRLKQYCAGVMYQKGDQIDPTLMAVTYLIDVGGACKVIITPPSTFVSVHFGHKSRKTVKRNTCSLMLYSLFEVCSDKLWIYVFSFGSVKSC